MNLFMEVAASGKMISFGENGLTAVLGYAVVFAGLLALMAILYLMGVFFKLRQKKRSEAVLPAALPAKQSAPEPEEPAGEPAPGSAGEIRRFDVPDKEAAMIMAIVADQMGKPLNELRFKSIKEVKKS
ncbi:MAG: OadG family protein [Oscillospiraceae bacterium]|nr:OadG family protein [Oscillospiraceae bacterium]